MDIRKNAPLTPKGRERSIIDEELSKAAATLQFSISAKTVLKWAKRFRPEGVDLLRNGSLPLRSLPNRPLRQLLGDLG